MYCALWTSSLHGMRARHICMGCEIRSRSGDGPSANEAREGAGWEVTVASGNGADIAVSVVRDSGPVLADRGALAYACMHVQAHVVHCALRVGGVRLPSAATACTSVARPSGCGLAWRGLQISAGSCCVVGCSGVTEHGAEGGGRDRNDRNGAI